MHWSFSLFALTELSDMMTKTATMATAKCCQSERGLSNKIFAFNIIILSFPLPKDPFSIQKDNITLKVHIISQVCDSHICSSLCLERDVSSTPTCTGRCLGYISCCNGLPLQGKYDLCTQMTSYHALHLLKSLGT